MMRKRLAKAGLYASIAALMGAWSMLPVSASEGTTSDTASGGMSTVGYLIFMVLLFAVMYFILIRPQKKKDKEAKAMQNSLQVGDEIVTIGGIVGMVVQVQEDTVVVETTGNRNKIRLKTWAIQENVTMSENAKREQEAKLAAAKARKEGKKKDKADATDKPEDGKEMLKD